MYSVTKRVKNTKQPYGGYLKRKDFSTTQLEDYASLYEIENIHASLIGTVVDYMTRFMMGAKIEEAFSISLKGALYLDKFKGDNNTSEYKYSLELLKKIKGIDENSIKYACKLAGFDVCIRSSILSYIPVQEIKPDKYTINNIIIMIKRSISFWENYGPIIKEHFTFEGGYTDIISSGDGDYLTQDTLWDFKVSKNEPTSKHRLQILIYYIMGMHSIHNEFSNIKKLGIYNPRLNKIYLINISLIPERVIDSVSIKIIGY